MCVCVCVCVCVFTDVCRGRGERYVYTLYTVHVHTQTSIFCTGKDNSLDDSNGVTHAVVLKLVEGLEMKGHHLYCDNYYSSPSLFSCLQQLGFGACGTVRCNRQRMPLEISSAKLQKGEVVTSVVQEGMTALKWRDKRQVTMLSTIHDTTMVTKRRRSRLAPGGVEEVQKPLMIDRYNMYMGGVDKADQLLAYYGFAHRTVKWWRRAFFHLLDNAIVNAYILYRISTQAGRKLDHKHFRIELAKQLLGSTPSPAPHHFSALHPQARLTERHFPEKIPPCSSGRASQPVCVVCSNKKGRGKKTTTYRCKQCLFPMCVVPCFELYHTKVDPARHLEEVM